METCVFRERDNTNINFGQTLQVLVESENLIGAILVKPHGENKEYWINYNQAYWGFPWPVNSQKPLDRLRTS